MKRIFNYLQTPDKNLIIGWFILVLFVVIQNYGIYYLISTNGIEGIKKAIEDYGLIFYLELYKYIHIVAVAYLIFLPIYLMLKLIEG
ncbi:hypothetical protein ACOL3H_06995 [Aliarcobacter butzleri]